MRNTLFPGRVNYSGPTNGLFGLLHHSILCEWSHDVRERVAYVKCEKPVLEVAVRLHNMIYLGKPAGVKFEQLYADYEAKCSQLYADLRGQGRLTIAYEAKRDQLDADYKAACGRLNVGILTYIKRRIPNCAWNGLELVFNRASAGAGGNRGE